MELERAQASLRAAQLCLAQGLFDSAVSRAYYALFQGAVCALESLGIRRREWTHRGVPVERHFDVSTEGIREVRRELSEALQRRIEQKQYGHTSIYS